MDCKDCDKRDTCTELCSEVQKQLDDESFSFYKASWYEFGYKEDTLEFLLNVKDYAGKRSLFDSISNIYNEENVAFIRYLITNHLSSRQSTILTDYYFNGLTQQKIAEKYSVRQPTVNFHIKQGLKNLKKMIKELI